MREHPDEFVAPRALHTFFRFGGLLSGLYMLYTGRKYNDTLLLSFGIVVSLVDLWTFSRAMRMLSES
jgi:hypothetical protein